MSFDPLSAIFDLGSSVIDKIWPDPIKRAEEMRKLEELKQTGDLAQLDAHVKIMLGQISINVEEAKHKSLFVSGWRPAVGWAGVAAMVYQFVVYPFLMWGWAILQAFGKIPPELEPPPILDAGALFAMITAMLGIGTMRSIDKRGGVQTDSIKGR